MKSNKIFVVILLLLATLGCTNKIVKKKVYLNSTNREGGLIEVGNNTVYQYYENDKTKKAKFDKEYIILEFFKKELLFKNSEIDVHDLRVLQIRMSSSQQRQISSYDFSGKIRVIDFKDIQHVTLDININCVDSRLDKNDRDSLNINKVITW